MLCPANFRVAFAAEQAEHVAAMKTQRAMAAKITAERQLARRARDKEQAVMMRLAKEASDVVEAVLADIVAAAERKGLQSQLAATKREQQERKLAQQEAIVQTGTQSKVIL